MRIVTGRLRGRIIPLSPQRQGDIRVTSSRLKESVFDRLGPDLHGVRFLDLCAGSGQIALEAYSRGAEVTAVEPDRRRRESLRQLLAEWGIDDLELLGRQGQGAMADLAAAGRRFDVAYLDPPYSARHQGRPLSEILLVALGRSGLLAAGGQSFLQHPRGMDLPERVDGLERVGSRRHGTTEVSEYRPTPARCADADSIPPP